MHGKGPSSGRGYAAGGKMDTKGAPCPNDNDEDDMNDPKAPKKAKSGYKLGKKMFLLPLLALLIPLNKVEAQNVNVVEQTALPSHIHAAQILSYDGSGNVNYACYARPDQPTTTWSVGSSTLTNIVVVSTTGTVNFPSNHGLQPGNSLVVSGSATTALNGTYQIVTVPSASSLTITVAGVGAATYTDASVASDAPRSTKPIWSIEHFVYASNNAVNIQWAGGAAGNYTNICDNKAVVNGTTVITYK
jgi:hypothetical protein